MFFLPNSPHLTTIQQLSKQRKVKVYLVGGFWRDLLLGRPEVDLDFALKKGAVPFAKAFARRIKGAFVLLDAEHRCARVVKKIDGRPVTFDFADFRAPTLAGDLAHRDFTINTLCAELGELKGPAEPLKILKKQKKALGDLAARRIRMASAKAFAEDPLRLLRAYSLRAMLDFSIEPKTLAQLRKNRSLLREVSYERIRDEFFKILSSGRAARTLREMDRAGILAIVIPQVQIMYDCHQGGYHHLDVWNHSLEVVAQFEKVLEETRNDPDVAAYMNEPLAGESRRRYALVKLAVLLHDVGKPQTKKVEPDRTSFHGHERVGKYITRAVAKMLKLSTKERYILEDIVLWHLRPGYLSNFKQPSERMIFRFLRDSKEEAASILLMSLADQRSTRGPLTTEEDQSHHENICLGLTKRFFDKKKEVPLVRLIDGNDLIKVLKLKPGPAFSKILRAVEEQQALGKVRTREEALKVARACSG